MSSKWVPVRDTILDALKIDVVTEKVKAGLDTRHASKKGSSASRGKCG